MRKTIFQRYLRITMIIVLLSFIMLGTVMLLFFSNYWQDEQKATLKKNVNMVASMSAQMLSDNSGAGAAALTFLISSYAQTIEADIFITDLDGQILLGTMESSQNTQKDSIDKNVIDEVVQNGYYEKKGLLSGFYEDDYFIVGTPLMVTQADGTKECEGSIIVAKTASRFNSFQQEATQIFLVASILALAVSFMVVGFFAYNLVRPLRQMSVAVNRFGNGDFSVRVPITTEDEIGQLALSFNNMADSLSNSESMRRSFIANVSHELKTPMTTIAGFVDGILDGTIPENEHQKYMQIVSEEVKRLSRLVKSMLDLSRIDSGEMRLNPQAFDLPGMIVKILLTFERSVEEKQLEIRGLENTGRLTVFGDQDLLYQVVYNLIENAVKFVNVGGYIDFTITDSIDRTSVAIKNSGDGIVSEELPMIFDRFYKTDKSRSKDKKGLGLGLYIVKMIVKLHGGEITVSSEMNQYCRFEFYIPKSKTEAPGKDGKDTKDYNVYDAEIISDTAELPPSDETKKE